MKRAYTASFAASCGLHAFVLFGLGSALIKPAEFGVQAGRNSLEVNLVAAPAEATPTPAPASAPVTPPPEPVKPDDFVIPEPVAPPEPRVPVLSPESSAMRPEPPSRPVQTSAPSTQHSGREKGKDSATMQSNGGARNETKPGYLRNPEPPYPEKARRLGQEGVVLLSVRVSERGEPESVEVKESSGHPLLDEAALKAVRRWVFSPATMGSVPISSQIEIPIRFDLSKSR